MSRKNELWGKARTDPQRVTFKHFLAFKFATEKKSARQVQEKLTDVRQKICAALEAVETQYQKKFWTGIVKYPTDKYMRSILNLALSLSYSQGMYHGLRDGWGFHKFSLDLERDPRKRLIVSYLREQTSRPTDRQICAHLDRILKIPQQGLELDLRNIVRTIRDNPNRTVQELANLLYADIMDLNARRERPTPLPKWKARTWTEALTSDATRNRVSKYLSDACKIANAKDCGFLEVWEKLGAERSSKTAKSK